MLSLGQRAATELLKHAAGPASVKSPVPPPPDRTPLPDTRPLPSWKSLGQQVHMEPRPSTFLRDADTRLLLEKPLSELRQPRFEQTPLPAELTRR